MVTKIKQIFKQAVLRFWSLRVPLIVVCILLAALLCTAQYQDSSRVASAQMTLNYSEASQGLNPNRTRFTTTDLTSDEVLQSTLYNAGLEGQMTVEQLRRAITVEPTDVTNVSSSENYITTSCSISLQLEEPCQHLTAATLLRIFCGSYKDYFMEHYGENQSVFSCTMPDYFDTEPYLRLKSLTLRANQLDRYLTARVSENKSYHRQHLPEPVQADPERDQLRDPAHPGLYPAGRPVGGCFFPDGHAAIQAADRAAGLSGADGLLQLRQSGHWPVR